MSKKRPQSRGETLNGVWVAVGIGAGTAIGVATKELGVGIGVGAAIGVCLGLITPKMKNRNDEGR